MIPGGPGVGDEIDAYKVNEAKKFVKKDEREKRNKQKQYRAGREKDMKKKLKTGDEKKRVTT